MRKLIPSAAKTVITCVFLLLSSGIVFTQQVNPALFSGMRWRLIGPFRAGRVSAGAIDPDPNTYYIGTPGGGVWKTTDAGQVWSPIFDEVHVASIGAIAVSPSNSKIVYVGTGEQTPGSGVYKSTDAGATWTNVGLRDTHFIGEILVDPANPDVVLVAAIGDRNSGAERGVFKSSDGGRTWTKVLFKEDAGGSASMVAALDNPKMVYATLAPAGLGRGAGAGRGAGGAVMIYKSTDQGSTWSPIGGKGLPVSGAGRQAIAIAAGTGGRRLYLNCRDGLHRSDDGGDTWEKWTTDPRIAGIGVIADPKNPDVLYVTQTSMYRSTDGGRTWASYVGAPSGDDFRLLWIDPRNSNRLLAGVDQGGIVSVDTGKTWSNWYTQPTAQLYHVSTDNAFPYRVYATQQDSGSVAVPSRSDFGEVSFRDWYSPGAFEWGFIAVDPTDSNIAYGEGWYNAIVRFDKRTEQLSHVFVPGSKYRSVQMTPLAFSPQDPHTLYLATQFVMKTTDAGMHWEVISPDLTESKSRPAPAVAPSGGPPLRAAIFSFSPSPVKRGMMWAGTNNGLVQVTEDGTSWREVTPPGLPAAATVGALEAGHHDAGTAYAVIAVPNDSHPYIYRTHDAGKTWQTIVAGLDESAFARVVREDPVRKGLLYAGTETSVYVSFDDGDRWQSLQLNLPTSSMRDLDVHGDDLIVGTYGRSIWILDDLTPLRQVDAQVAASEVHFFKPQTAMRWRWDMNQDTPLPIETPVGQNPPDGAIVDYYLKSAPAGEITLTIADARGAVVRRYTSTPPPAPTLPANVPEYWFAPPVALPKAAGLNRFAWNLRYPNPKVLPFGYFGGFLKYVEYTLADHAIPGQTPREQPEGALVAPGEYVATLEVNGRSYRQPITVKPDPRVRATQADLVEQEASAKQIADLLAVSYDVYYQLTAHDAKSKAADAIGVANRDLARYLAMLESGDSRPAETLRAAVAESCEALVKALGEARSVPGAAIPAAPACGGR
jgi:photosystem II stability/assembly factor-like uncharacterized protein